MLNLCIHHKDVTLSVNEDIARHKVPQIHHCYNYKGKDTTFLRIKQIKQ